MAEGTTDKEINILVLGETGVGKSTWINSFANYLQYDSLEEAEKNEIVTVIPTSFTITDDNYEEQVITTGSDGNEVQRAGESATQRPRTYAFPYKDLTVRIIDTPGVGDSRGPSQDKINFQMIMDHLACYKEVHGVCILMKPNNARITILFEFCIKHLLTHLHKDAIRNIVFCFTNARNTFYRPGETLRALRQLLLEFQDLEIRLDKTTMYCLDNESIQYLAAVNAGLNFDDQRDVYAKSWEISSKETQRLLNHILDLEPHVLQNTLSLNDARRVILGLTQPLADIGKNIQKNILEAKKKESEVKNSKADRHELEKHLYIPVVGFSVVYLTQPLQVCTAANCCKEITLDTGEQTTQHNCHKPAKKGMMMFKLFRPKKCSRCGCPKTTHTDIFYEIKEELKQVESPRLAENIKKLDSSIEHIVIEFLSEILERIKVLEKEQAEILTISSQFAHFLKTNAIAPYNDTMIRYLDQQIETAKLSSNGSADENLKLLLKMKVEYEAEVEILKEKMEHSSSKGIQAGDIPKLKQELICLPINGQYIKEILDQQDKGPVFGLDERFVQVGKNGARGAGAKPKGRKTMFGLPILAPSGNKGLKQPKTGKPKPIYAAEKNLRNPPTKVPLPVVPARPKSNTGSIQIQNKPASNKGPAPAVPDKRPGITRQSAAPPEPEVVLKPRPPSADLKPKIDAQLPPKPGSIRNSTAAAPPPPPPPAQPNFPATVQTAAKVDGARSALLNQIHKGVTLKKVDPFEIHHNLSKPTATPRTALGSTGGGDYANTSNLKSQTPLDAALKKALSERFKAHKSDSVEDLDAADADDSEWQD